MIYSRSPRVTETSSHLQDSDLLFNLLLDQMFTAGFLAGSVSAELLAAAATDADGEVGETKGRRRRSVSGSGGGSEVEGYAPASGSKWGNYESDW